MFIHPPPPLSMHQVIYVEQVACAMNKFMQLLPGGTADAKACVNTRLKHKPSEALKVQFGGKQQLPSAILRSLVNNRKGQN